MHLADSLCGSRSERQNGHVRELLLEHPKLLVVGPASKAHSAHPTHRYRTSMLSQQCSLCALDSDSTRQICCTCARNSECSVSLERLPEVIAPL